MITMTTRPWKLSSESVAVDRLADVSEIKAFVDANRMLNLTF
jgi:hypothetical protein